MSLSPAPIIPVIWRKITRGGNIISRGRKKTNLFSHIKLHYLDGDKHFGKTVAKVWRAEASRAISCSLLRRTWKYQRRCPKRSPPRL